MKSFLTMVLLATSACAQVHHHAADEKHASIDLSKLPSPQHLVGIGLSHLKITTKSAEAQQWFDQGLAAMHCFWDYEALRAFEEAVRKDPDCAMCHWGISRALDFRGDDKPQSQSELGKAKDLSAQASDHEQRYVRAYAALAEKKDDDDEAEFAKQMESLIDRYPDDLEAKLLYAGTLISGYDEEGNPRKGAVYGQSLLQSLLHDHPDSAAANHYWIHAVEGSGHPEWALASAQKLGSLAPASGHMVHMPGHVYFRVGDYERARQIFLDSARVDREYMAAQKVAPSDDWNYAHNISYLIADCAEEGRYAEAREHIQALNGLANDPDQSGNPFFYVFQIGPTEQRLAIRFGNWDSAIRRPVDFGVADDKLSAWVRGYRNGLLSYARGMKAAEAGQFTEALRQSDLLDSLLWRLSAEEVDDDNKSRRDRVLKLLGTASLELRGNIVARQGDLERGRKLLEQAAREENKLGYSEPPLYSRPPLEVLGEVLIEAGKFSEAREAYKRDLQERPKSGFAIFGIARAWDQEGNREQATKAYKEFLAVWEHADSDLPQIKAAEAYLSLQTPKKR